MARGAWQQPALLASLLAVAADGKTLTAHDFNPFYAAQRGRKAPRRPYDPAELQRLQNAMERRADGG
jgi:hypothetical protein